MNKKKYLIIGSVALAVITAVVLLVIFLPKNNSDDIPDDSTTIDIVETDDITVEDVEKEETTDKETLDKIEIDGTALTISIDNGFDKKNTGEKAEDVAKPVTEAPFEEEPESGNGGTVIGGMGGEKYSCGVSGHHCDGPETHAYILNFELEGCPYCASHKCTSFYATDKCFGWTECNIKQYKTQAKIFCSEETELTKEEYKRLVKTAQSKGNDRLCLILQTICGTGIRVSELQFITVEALQTGRAKVRCKGKDRQIMIVSDLKKLLRRYVIKCGIKRGPIFVTKKGKPLDRTNIWREMKRLCHDAKVSEKKVFPHNLRHLFARIFYKMEKDIAYLADVLGHSNINTTRIYIISTGAEHKRRMENMRLII